jgi:hypothetical protein
VGMDLTLLPPCVFRDDLELRPSYYSGLLMSPRQRLENGDLERGTRMCWKVGALGDADGGEDLIIRLTRP